MGDLALNFSEFFDLIKPRSWWNKDEGWWYCEGCSIQMDKPELINHWPFNCSLTKKKRLLKLRIAVIEANQEQFSKFRIG